MTPLLLLPTLVTVGTPRWHCTGDQCTGLDRESSGHTTNQRFGHPSAYPGTAWVILGSGQYSSNATSSFFQLVLPFLLQHFVTGAVSHPAVVGHGTHKASSLVDDVLELLLFHQAAQADGKAGGRQTQSKEVNFSD